MNEQEFAELAAGHALGALDPADERIYLDALALHPEWSDIADEDAATAAALADSVAAVAPPRALRGALLARLDDIVQEGPVPPAVIGPDHASAKAGIDTGQTESARPRWMRTWFALAASIALILGVAGIATVVSQQNQSPAQVALQQIEAAPDAAQASSEVAGGGEAVLHWSATVGEAVLVVGDLPAIAADQTFEAWYIRDGTPISAGTFEPAGGSTSALLDAGMVPGDLIALTVEQDGGAPDGQPTTDPILAIETA